MAQHRAIGRAQSKESRHLPDLLRKGGGSWIHTGRPQARVWFRRRREHHTRRFHWPGRISFMAKGALSSGTSTGKLRQATSTRLAVKNWVQEDTRQGKIRRTTSSIASETSGRPSTRNQQTLHSGLRASDWAQALEKRPRFHNASTNTQGPIQADDIRKGRS